MHAPRGAYAAAMSATMFTIVSTEAMNSTVVRMGRGKLAWCICTLYIILYMCILYIYIYVMYAYAHLCLLEKVISMQYDTHVICPL